MNAGATQLFSQGQRQTSTREGRHERQNLFLKTIENEKIQGQIDVFWRFEELSWFGRNKKIKKTRNQRRSGNAGKKARELNRTLVSLDQVDKPIRRSSCRSSYSTLIEEEK